MGSVKTLDVDSCVDLETETESTPSSGASHRSENQKQWGMSTRSSVTGNKHKELLLPLLIQMSTVMKQYYTDDGRLVFSDV